LVRDDNDDDDDDDYDDDDEDDALRQCYSNCGPRLGTGPQRFDYRTGPRI